MGGKHPPGYMHDYWVKNKEKISAKKKEYYETNKIEINSKRRLLHTSRDKAKHNKRNLEYYYRHRDELKEKMRQYRLKHSEELRQQKKIHYKEKGWTNKAVRDRAARLNIIALLGGKCVRCGYSDPRALQVDHIHGNGWHESQSIGFYAIYKKILNGKTEGYQLLCANCNWIKRSENGELGKNRNNRKWVESQHKKQP